MWCVKSLVMFSTDGTYLEKAFSCATALFSKPIKTLNRIRIHFYDKTFRHFVNLQSGQNPLFVFMFVHFQTQWWEERKSEKTPSNMRSWARSALSRKSLEGIENRKPFANKQTNSAIHNVDFASKQSNEIIKVLYHNLFHMC